MYVRRTDILSYRTRIPMVLIALINFGPNICSMYDEKDWRNEKKEQRAFFK